MINALFKFEAYDRRPTVQHGAEAYNNILVSVFATDEDSALVKAQKLSERRYHTLLEITEER